MRTAIIFLCLATISGCGGGDGATALPLPDEQPTEMVWDSSNWNENNWK